MDKTPKADQAQPVANFAGLHQSQAIAKARSAAG
jgi:hypothetical protein